MKELIIKNYKGINVTDSREVAEMIGKKHDNLLRDIRGYIKVIEESSKLRSQDFFVESIYKNSQNKSQPCYLLTKQGCEMVANKMTGEKGILFTAEYVQAFNKMEEHIKEQTLNTSELSPELQMFGNLYKAIANQELEQKKIKKDIEDTKNQLQGIRDVVALTPNAWRKDTSSLISKIAMKLGGFDHIKDVREESYKILNETYKVDINRRLLNKQKNMALEGCSKSKINKLNYLDVIAEDEKLINGYLSIISKMAIKYGVDMN